MQESLPAAYLLSCRIMPTRVDLSIHSFIHSEQPHRLARHSNALSDPFWSGWSRALGLAKSGVTKPLHSFQGMMHAYRIIINSISSVTSLPILLACHPSSSPLPSSLLVMFDADADADLLPMMMMSVLYA
jgi:hypothetical protein